MIDIKEYLEQTKTVLLTQDAFDELKQRASAQSEQKSARWTKAYDGNDGHVKCTCCFKIYDWISQAQYYNFCPNCGADMRGDNDDIPIEYFESGGK